MDYLCYLFHAFASGHCCLHLLEKVDFLALACEVCVFVTFQCGIMGQAWYLIVSIPDLWHLSYFAVQLSNLLWSVSENPHNF